MSLGLFGDETKHTYVRLLAATEVLQHPAHYSSTAEQYVVKDTRIDCSSYAKVLNDVLIDGTSVEMVHLFAVSATLNVTVQSYVPPSVSFGLIDNFNDSPENELTKLLEVIVEDTQFVYYYMLQ